MKHAVKLAGSGVPIEVVLLDVQPEVEAWQTHGMARKSMVEHRQELGRKAAKASETALRAAGIRYTLLIEIGDPAETIARVAAKQDCDLIVMGTRGMTAMRNLVIGSVAFKVVHLARTPVTLVK